MRKNFYKVLGIAVTATADEVKVAFRRRAMELHPDQSGLESGPFLEIQEAYAILSDPEQRRLYDAETFGGRAQPGVTSRSMGNSGRAEPFRAVGRAGGFPGDLFEELLMRFWNSPKIPHPSEPTYPEDLTVEVAISPQKAWFGGTVHVRLPVLTRCPACRGGGRTEGHFCRRCGGEGKLCCEVPLALDLPAGVHDYAQIRVPLEQYGLPDCLANIVLRIRRGGWSWM